jgi:spore cortex formation protein SpoVR/YcgB (stage V sporulation)
MRLFALADKASEPALTVSAIHDERGYKRVRRDLARQFDVGRNDPNIQVVDAALRGDRSLSIVHYSNRGVPLHEHTRDQVLGHIERLWGHEVEFSEEVGEPGESPPAVF